MIQIIPIETIPENMIVPLNGIDYELNFKLNKRFNFISVSISKDGVLLRSTKVVYGSNPVFGMDSSIPNLIPMTENDLSTDNFESVFVNGENLGKTVFIYFDDGSNV